MTTQDELLLQLRQIGADDIADGLENVADSLANLEKSQEDFNATGEKAAEANKEQKKSLLEVNAALDLFGKGINAAKEFAQQAIGDTMEYAKSVRELSTNIGISVEETSKIIQAADDYGIGVGEVTSALEMMTRRGIAPSIDKLASLADQFKSIQDPVKRAEAMTEAFGRSWTTLTPLLSAGGDALRESAEEAEGLGLVLSEADVQAARDLEIGLDNLGDKAEALALKIGKGLIPAINGLLDQAFLLEKYLQGTGTQAEKDADIIRYLTNMYGENSTEVKLAIAVQKKHTDELERNATSRDAVIDGIKQQNALLIRNGSANVWATAGVKAGGTALYDYGVSVDDVRTQIEALEIKRQLLFEKGFVEGSAQLLKVKAEMDALKTSIGDTGPEIESLEGDLIRLAEKGFERNSVQVQKVIDKLADLRLKTEVTVGAFSKITPSMEDAFLASQAALGPYEESIDKAALSMKELTTQTIFNTAAQGLSAEAALTLATRMGLVDKGAEGAVRAIESMKRKQQDGKMSADEYATSILKIQDAIAGLKDKNVKVTIDTIQREIRAQELEQRKEETGKLRAYGGAVGAGVPYIVGEQGRETFVPQQAGIVVPNNITTTITNNITTDQMGVALAMARAQQMTAEARM